MKTILIFFCSFVFISIIILSITIYQNNKDAKLRTRRFLNQVNCLNPILLLNIDLTFMVVSGQKYWGLAGNKCDIYLLDNHLTLIRSTKFLIRIDYEPLIISFDPASVAPLYKYLVTYKPEEIYFKKVIRGEVDIKLVDPKYKHRKIEITLMGLSENQLKKLERIKAWV